MEESSAHARKRSEVARELSEQHEIELKEQIELLNDDTNEREIKPLRRKRIKTGKESTRRPPISGKNFLRLNMNIQSTPSQAPGQQEYSSIGPVGPPSGFPGA